MTGDDPLTRREAEALNSSIRDLNQSIRDLRVEMSQTYVRKDVIQPTLDELRKDIDGHSEVFTWLARIVIGVVILALLALVVSQGHGPSV